MRSICLQLFAVYALSAFCAYVAEIATFNSRLNLLWMAGLPIATASVTNRNKGVIQATVMASVLLVCAVGGLITAMIYTGA